ncbi:MAG TPA: hypothetical protein VEX38_05940 [Fimbriimonadaceae bacterium]|nr:hypothetical protein [Fimbriimonadaceae bacterium]
MRWNPRRTLGSAWAILGLYLEHNHSNDPSPNRLAAQPPLDGSTSSRPELNRLVVVGFANDDIHYLQVRDAQEAGQLATEEAKEIGVLTNAGFRTVVAAAWMVEESKTAGLTYAAAWNENEVLVLLHYGDRIATSHELFKSLKELEGGTLTAGELLRYCKRLKIA